MIYTLRKKDKSLYIAKPSRYLTTDKLEQAAFYRSPGECRKAFSIRLSRGYSDEERDDWEIVGYVPVENSIEDV